MEIILLRHGKPIIPAIDKIPAFLFIDWIKAYNFSDLCPTSTPSQETLNLIKKCGAIVCSKLPRSTQSANALKIKTITLSDSQFNEAGLPSANWNTIKLSPITWSIIFRILWLFGYSKNSESYKTAKVRAHKAANILMALAKQHKSVLFVGHGIYNRLLVKELKLSGWSGPNNPGSKYWGFGIYKKENSN